MIGAHFFLVTAALIALVAAYIDYKTGHIPNWLTLPALCAAPVAHLFAAIITGHAGRAIEAAGFSIAGAVLAALIPLLLYRANAIGGGDVKLLAALGALCMPMIGVEAEFYAFMAAALFAPARLLWQGKLLLTLKNTLAIITNPFRAAHKRREVTPEMMTSLRFGPAIFVGMFGAAFMQWTGK